MQCAGEYWEDSENPRATQLHKLNHDERRLIPTDNLSCEQYLSWFGSLAAVSAAKSNKFFKAKRKHDDLVFDKKMTTEDDEVVVLKATKSIVKELNCMEISWTDQQKKRLKDKIENAVKKNTCRGNYKDLLRQCKNHGGPVGLTEYVQKLVSETSNKKKLKSYLRSEVGFQKALHPFDSKERSYLYKMNFASAEEFAENLMIHLNVSQNPDAAEGFELPTEEEMYKLIFKGDDSSSGSLF